MSACPREQLPVSFLWPGRGGQGAAAGSKTRPTALFLRAIAVKTTARESDLLPCSPGLSGRTSPGRRQGQGRVGRYGQPPMPPACTVPVTWFWEPPAFQTTALAPLANASPPAAPGAVRTLPRGCSRQAPPGSERCHLAGCDLLPLQGCCRWRGDRGTHALVCSHQRHVSRSVEQLLVTLGFGKANARGCWLLEACCPSATGWSLALQQHRGCQPPSPSSLPHAPMNSSTSSWYEPGSAGWGESRGKAPRSPPELRIAGPGESGCF